MTTQIEFAPQDIPAVTENHIYERQEIDHEQQPSKMTKVIAIIKEFATISEILRILGAMIMIASMSMFLLQGWSDGNDIQRYLKLLTQTGLLAGGGFLMSYLLKENKGARLFFGLSLVSIPANFTILGALIYSVTQWDGSLINYPEFASWKIINPSMVSFVAGGALLLLSIVTLFSFTIMARRSAKMLTINFLALNSLLLLPLRGSLATGVLIIVATFYAAYIIQQLYKQDSTLTTFEGKFSLALLIVPAILLIVRSLFLYEFDIVLELTLSACAFITLRQISMMLKEVSVLRAGLEILSIPVAYSFMFSAFNFFENFVQHDLVATLAVIILAVFIYDFSQRTSRKNIGTLNTIIASFLIATIVTINLLSYDTAASVILGFASGLGLVYFGLRSQIKLLSLLGISTTLMSIYYGLQEIFEIFMNSGWLGFAITGASAIVIASILERHGATIKLKLTNWKQAVSQE